MRNKRFIFTIDQATRDYISKLALDYNISKSNAIKKIVNDHRKSDRRSIGAKNITIKRSTSNELHKPTARSSTHVKAQYSIDLLNTYTTPDLASTMMQQDLTEQLSNEDIDWVIYTLCDLVANDTPSNELKILYAKALKHRGFLTEALSVLNSIEDAFSIEKYLLQLSINISLGEIPKAHKYLIKCTELLNTSNYDRGYHYELMVLQAEFIWIHSGVVDAYRFVNKCIRSLSYQISKSSTTKATSKVRRCILGKLYCLRGEFLRDKGEFQRAKTAYKQALEYLDNCPYEGIYLSRSLKGLGSIYKKEGQIKLSTRYIFNALDISRKFGDRITESGVLASVGGLYMMQNKHDLGIKMLQEKADIGRNTNSLREIFYASYDLGMANITQGNYAQAREVIEGSRDFGKRFKRVYYLDMWRGLLESFDNLEAGVKIIQSSRDEAINAKEDKKIYLSEYLIAAAYMQDEENREKGQKVLHRLIKNESVSKQLRNNAQELMSSHKNIKSV